MTTLHTGALSRDFINHIRAQLNANECTYSRLTDAKNALYTLADCLDTLPGGRDRLDYDDLHTRLIGIAGALRTVATTCELTVDDVGELSSALLALIDQKESDHE